MTNFRYANSYVQESSVVIGGTVPETIGTLLSEYQVHEYWDLRQANVPGSTIPTTAAMRAYVVSLRQKVTIANPNANSFNNLYPISSYSSYPVLMVQEVQVAPGSESLGYYLEDYSPKTLNAAISVSASAATNSDAASSVQYTRGSSTSSTNSYEISDSVGFFGADPTGSVSASVGQSTTNSSESSMSTGSTDSRGRQTSTGSGMTVKDWASYAFLDTAKQQPSWVWGQEYPWNVIDFRNIASSAGGNEVILPPYVMQRLFDGTTVFPPSEIAQFGLDFTANARWIFYIPGAAGPTDEVVTFSHAITLWQGSHSSTAAQLTIITPNPNQPVDSVQLNLPVLSLAPIIDSGSQNNAVVGFVNTEFISAPSASTSTFRLKSSANNIYVCGSGFGPLATSDSIFSANNVTVEEPAVIQLQFKVVNANLELSLYIKHWKNSPAGCIITAAINEPNPTQPILPIVRHVDALEGGSGGDNVTVITLRSKDYTSSDFYDYLVMGLNTIYLTVAPDDGQGSCDYCVRAIAIS